MHKNNVNKLKPQTSVVDITQKMGILEFLDSVRSSAATELEQSKVDQRIIETKKGIAVVVDNTENNVDEELGGDFLDYNTHYCWDALDRCWF